MASFVSSFLHHTANKIEDMPLFTSRSNKKKVAASEVQQQQQQHQQQQHHYPYPFHHNSSSSSVISVPPPPYYDCSSPTPSPSTSWTSQMSALADKIRDEPLTAAGTGSKPVSSLDRKSISQGLKLVSIAADEYEEGNDEVALDIYLTGLDKILMALPNKADPKTKLALREKLLSVEERVGILNWAIRNRETDASTDSDNQSTNSTKSLQKYLMTRIGHTLSSLSSTVEARYTPPKRRPSQPHQHAYQKRVSPASAAEDPIYRFKQLGQFIIQGTVTLAVIIKQSPLPDIVSFLFGYFIQLLLWVDSQYHIMQRVQDCGIECVKLLLQADEEYRLHEFISEAVYMFIAAFLKATVAYKETPGFNARQTFAPQIQVDAAVDEQAALPEAIPAAALPQPLPPSRFAWAWSRS
ncbi:hypothetical protein BCR43DRAFT_563970 [Syncephalastrum racemosum]|uniref:MIT domain-containing protein n=1 Tax=Syncephalastrum racemosum TaxID=13706 RepID=A0A1X2HD65_SYNRA|nr:hypothetical protein BCR43DRAFT_563970 [Syncephalastrum racemosum]